jgi:hypothetical protein
MLPDWTQSLAYLGITAAVAGMVALPRTGKPRTKMPESSRTGKRSIRRPPMRRHGPRVGRTAASIQNEQPATPRPANAKPAKIRLAHIAGKPAASKLTQ